MNDLEPRLRSPLLSPRFSRIAGYAAIVLVVHGLRSVSFFERTFNPEGGAAWQWDFESYYYAVKVHQAGGNPYDAAALAQAAGHSVFPFAYPPHTLTFFSLFDIGDAAQSKHLFLGVKLATVGVLLAIWILGFIPRGLRGWFFAFAALGIQTTIARDLTAGNVCAFEQLPLWIGILALVRGSPALFCAMVVLAAQFKVQPIALLGLLWFRPMRRRWTCLGAGVGALGLILAASYLHDPELAAAYFRSSFTLAAGESGLDNPSALKLWTEILMMVLGPYDAFNGVNRRHAALVVYPLAVGVMYWATFRSLPADRRDRRWLHLGILTFAVTAPRMTSYSWSVALVPTFELLRRLLPAAPATLPVVLLAALYLTMPLRETAWIYRPYLLTFMLWMATIFSYGEAGVRPSPVDSHGEETHI